MRNTIAVLTTLLALLAAPGVTAQSPIQSRIVGAWYTGDPSTEASAVIVFLEDGEYVQIAGARSLNAPRRRDGYELGTYTFDEATGAFSVVTATDTNAALGLSGLSGVQGAKADVSADTLTLVIPGQGVVTFNRVANPSPIVGAWVDGGKSIAALAIVLLPDHIYYFFTTADFGQNLPSEIGHGRFYVDRPGLAAVGDEIVWYVETTSATAGFWTLGNDISVPISRVGASYAAPAADPASTAVEYHHAETQHYFLTALAEERLKLDSGEIRGWARTGRSFRVFPLHEPGTSAVCRFVSNGPKVSHFHTAFADECAAVMANPYWTFEGEVFSFKAPDAGGSCATGTIPLYRLYNNGRTGAPNHRLTTSPATRSELLAQGHVAEGVGREGVAGCVPQ